MQTALRRRLFVVLAWIHGAGSVGLAAPYHALLGTAGSVVPVPRVERRRDACTAPSVDPRPDQFERSRRAGAQGAKAGGARGGLNYGELRGITRLNYEALELRYPRLSHPVLTKHLYCGFMPNNETHSACKGDTMYNAQDAELIVAPLRRMSLSNGDRSVSISVDDDTVLDITRDTEGYRVWLLNTDDDDVMHEGYAQTYRHAVHIAWCMLQGIPRDQWIR